MVCPMKLTSVQRAPLWSGTALQGLLGIGAPGERIGEDLVLAVHSAADTGEPDCRVENGMFAGMRLRDVPGVPDPFPLLIKLIDAGEDLSLQVHPSDPGTEGGEKTEMWLILHAEPGARLLYGLRPEVSFADFCRSVRAGCFDMSLCRSVPVRAGECYFVPAGMLHAIGGGILLAEIQQNCDITYRVYDYGRADSSGKPRELHTEKALAALRTYSDAQLEAMRFSCGRDAAPGERLLACCPQFRVSEWDCETQIRLPDADDPYAVLCIGGEGDLLCDGRAYPLRFGDCYWVMAEVPAPNPPLFVRGKVKILTSRVPDPKK